MSRFLLSVVIALFAMIAIVFAVYGIGPDGLLAVIHATARSSAICFALAFAKIRRPELLIALPLSHALHYAAILALAVTTTSDQAHLNAVTAIGGTLIYALMVFTAIRPAVTALYALWIIFLVGFAGRDISNPVYPAIVIMLVVAQMRFEWTRRPRAVER